MNRMKKIRGLGSKKTGKGDSGNKEKKGIDEKRHSWRALKRAACYLAKDAPAVFPLTLLIAAMSAVYPYIGIFLSAEILTELADPERSMRHLFTLALWLVGLNFLGKRLIDLFKHFLEVAKYTAMKHVVRTVAEKAWQMDYSMSAKPGINETKERLTRWFYSRGVMALSKQLHQIFSSLVTIGISVALVVEFLRARTVGDGALVRILNHWAAGAVFAVLFVLSIGYSIFASAREEKVNRWADEETSKPLYRMNLLLDSCFSNYQRGKDVRMFGGQELLLEKTHRCKDEFEGIFIEAVKKEQILRMGAMLFARLFNLLVYLFVGVKALYGAFGVGSVLKYVGMVNQLGAGVMGLGDAFRSVLQNVEYINVFFRYLDMPNATFAGTLPITEQIREDYHFEFKNVTFTYPGADVPSLSKVNCRFGKGEKIAIVGRNGSGKTTFIKLLCRLCDPQEGEILLNGVDIRKYQYEEYLTFFSTVFQDYKIFAFKLGENVAAESEYDREKAAEALVNAGFGQRLDTLEKGLDTQLFHHFSEEGVELSGGESQKVAIARCLYKDAPYVVMDEPTAALDPVAEADIYQRMSRFTRDKGAIYISHRLSSCHFCDRILVFEEGKIAEEGSHEELLSAGGLYRRLWDAQARYYAE